MLTIDSSNGESPVRDRRFHVALSAKDISQHQHPPLKTVGSHLPVPLRLW